MTAMTDRDEPDAVVGGGPSPARRLREELVDDAFLDRLMAGVDEQGVSLTGVGGFLPELVKAVLERGMDVELTDHLGYERGDPGGWGSPNSRNGTTPKTVQTEVGPIGLDVPRDRTSSFSPALVPKGQRRLGGLDQMIISLYAGGMTVRDIQHHLARTLGTELSHETISNVTDAVLEEVKAWQTRPLEELYPIVYLDALVVKVATPTRCGTRPRTSRSGSTSTGSSTSSGSGSSRPRGRSSGPGSAPSSPTAASATSSSPAATG